MHDTSESLTMSRFVYVLGIACALLAGGPGTAGEHYGARRMAVEVADRKGFILHPPKPAEDGTRPWVWYAPTIGAYPNKSNEWVLRQLLDQGLYVCGVDVGESY